jgi:hypothetical protein
MEEFHDYEIYKLTTENSEIIQGLMSLNADDGFIYISKIERANFKKTKLFEGILDSMFAFACKKAFGLGFNGAISFFAKTKLINLYRTRFGAMQIGTSQRMFIDSMAAQKLVDLHYEKD